jgi:alkanesulfonate monooxygenase SsuD/methylene tetrahydromethanopterin reductase-like flavin-dependent oxidoreductase (luciferase family)
MKFCCFHFLPYLHANLDFRADGGKSLWMIRQHDFDAEKCHALYQRYLDELEFVDGLGFDGVCVNEHHQTPHSLMPSPNVIAGALTQRIKNGKIFILGRALPLLDNPLAVAEEWAMLDNISGGRIVCGMVRGIGIEYHASGVNPAESQARYVEAHDLIVEAWTRPGPFAFEGEYYEFNYVNPFPRPYTQPHPPVWIPSGGNPETLAWAAAPERKYTYCQFFNAPYEGVKRTLNAYREAARDSGYEAKGEQLAWAVPSYVAETDEQAIDEARPHIEALFNDFMSFPKEMLLPPGYSSIDSMINAFKAQAVGGRGGGRTTIEELMEKGIVHIGSFETVRNRIRKAHADTGLGYILAMLQFGTMPADLTRKNMEQYYREIVEPLRAELSDDASSLEERVDG